MAYPTNGFGSEELRITMDGQNSSSDYFLSEFTFKLALGDSGVFETEKEEAMNDAIQAFVDRMELAIGGTVNMTKRWTGVKGEQYP